MTSLQDADEAWADLLARSEPPGDDALAALWWAEKGDWERAHECAQRGEGRPDCDLVHAHLHRQEGDAANANYWYNQAQIPVSELPIADERRSIALGLLARRAATRP